MGERDDDDRGAWTGGRVVGQLTDAARDEHPKRHVAAGVDLAHRLPQPGLEVGVGWRHIERETVRGRAEPRKMTVE